MCAGDKGSETRDGKAERYNVMNLFMQYNLAHSDYNSAKFNWIVYSRRSRYDQSKRGPARLPSPTPSPTPSLLFHPSLSARRRETKEISSSFLGSRGRLLNPAQRGEHSSPFGSRVFLSSIFRPSVCTCVRVRACVRTRTHTRDFVCNGINYGCRLFEG